MKGTISIYTIQTRQRKSGNKAIRSSAAQRMTGCKILWCVCFALLYPDLLWAALSCAVMAAMPCSVLSCHALATLTASPSILYIVRVSYIYVDLKYI